MPCMSASGNMRPQSISRRRSLCSTTMQLRPISPRPPRKAMWMGSGMSGYAGRFGKAARQCSRPWRTSRALASSQAGAGPIGRRASPTARPRTFMSALVGMGLGASSPVSNAKLSSSREWTRRAPTRSPFSQWSNRSWWSSPVQCVATPMIPTAPTASSGSVMESSPE